MAFNPSPHVCDLKQFILFVCASVSSSANEQVRLAQMR